MNRPMSRRWLVLSGVLGVALSGMPGPRRLAAEPPASSPSTQPGAGNVEELLTKRFAIKPSANASIAELPTYATAWSDAQIVQQRTLGQQLLKDLPLAIKSGKHAFTVAPGVYRVPGGKITLNNVQDLTIDCAGVTFITEDAGAGINLMGCYKSKNIALRGPMTWDTTDLPYREGRIVALDEKALTFDLEMLAGYRLDEYPHTNQRFHVFDPGGNLLTWAQQTYVKATRLEGRRVRVQLRPEWFNWSHPMVGQRQMKIGNIVALEGSGASLTTYGDCENMSLQDITIHTGVAHLYEHGTRGFSKQINVRCITPPGTNRLVAGQPIQHMISSGALIYDGCEFGVGWDDGINLLSLFHLAARQEAPRQLLVASRDRPVNVGSTLTFYDFNTFATLGAAAVAGVEKVMDPATAAGVVGFTRLHRMTQIDRVNLYRVTLDRDVAVTQHAVIETSDERADEVIVRNCYFHDANAQILLLQGAKKGLIEDNLLVRSAGPAVHMGFSVYWWEGPVPSHFLIRDNVIRDNPVYLPTPGETPGSICIRCGTMTPTHARLLRDITIENNTIINSSCSAIYVRNADGVIIRDNLIINPACRPLLDQRGKPADFGSAAISLDSTSHVSITGNYIDMSKSMSREPIGTGEDVDRTTLEVSGNRIVLRDHALR